MAGILLCIRQKRLSFLGLFLLLIVAAPVPAAAGAVYGCDTGEVHQFWGCVNPEKPPPLPCQPSAGNPVDVLYGRKHQEVLDWSSGGLNPLELKRSYSSSPFTLAASPYSSIGRGWRTNFDARARWGGNTLSQADWVHVVLPDNFEYHFNKQSGVWRSMVPLSGGTSTRASSVVWRNRNDLNVSLTIDGAWIILRTPDDVEYVFDSGEHEPVPQYRSDGLHTSVLTEIRFRGGFVQKLDYSEDRLTRVSDSLGRWIELDYAKVSPKTMYMSELRTFDGSAIKYSYENRFPSLNTTQAVDFWALSTVIYPDSTLGTDSDNPRVRYEYVDAVGRPGLLLSGIVDERGTRFASWTYDNKSRVLTSRHAGGTDLWQFTYDDAGNAVTVSNPLGRATRYSYRRGAGAIRQLVAVDGIATSNCAASNTQYSYDANGFRIRALDAEGRVTQWQRDARGLPLSYTEAAESGAARGWRATWDANRSLLTTMSRPGLTTQSTYGRSGQVSSEVRTDTTSQPALPKSGGQTRTTRYVYSSLQPSVRPPPGPSGSPLPDVPLRLVNAGADQGTTGWMNAYGGIGVAANGGGHPCPPSNPCFFGGGNSQTLAYQDIAIPAENISEVDIGRRAAKLEWRQTSLSCCGDYGSVLITFIDGSGAVIGSLVPPLAKPADWKRNSHSGPVPPGTRVIRVAMLMYRIFGYSNDGLIDDIAIALIADGSASPNPFLSVVNPSGLFGTSGWSVQSGSDAVTTMSAYAACPHCTYFTNTDRSTGNSSVSQVLSIPADRLSEIDDGRRGLMISWSASANSNASDVLLSVEFADAVGRPLSGGQSFGSILSTSEVLTQRHRITNVPHGARQVKLKMSTVFPSGLTGSRSAYWSGVSVQLVPAAELPSSAFDLLSAIDGPLPGPSDTVRYGYDATGNLASFTNELGHVTRITARDAGGRPLSIVDPNGVTTAMAYDARGRLVSVTVNPGASQARTLIAYDAVGQVTRVTSPDGSYLQYGWSDARRLVSVVSNAGERIDYGHDAMGNITSRSVKSASGAIIRQQSALFDELGRLMRSIGAGGQQTLFQYDRTDNLTLVQDPRGGLFSYAYDGLQRIASLTDQAGSRVKLERDASDGITSYRDPRGLTTTYVRNGFGEVIQESGPDVGTTVIERDERGLATRITDPRGIVTTLVYDKGGRLVKEAHPASPVDDVTYSYDSTANGNKGIGRLTGITDASGSLSRVYDALGRVTAESRVIAGKSYVVTYGYNAAGRLTAIGYPSGRVVGYGRNAVGRVASVATRATASAAVDTVASGLGWSPMSRRLTGFTHGNGLATAMSYDGDGRIASLRLSNGSTRVADLSYAYRDGMNLTAVNDNVSAARSLSLAYDAAQRLVYAAGPWGTLTYAYTPTGDRTQEVLAPPGGGSPLATLLRYPPNSNRLAMTSVGNLTTRSFGYDAAGNMVSQLLGATERLDILYNLRNRPVMVKRTGDGTQVSSYLFNALEQMVQRRTTAPAGPRGTVHYIYGLDGSLLAEADGATGAITREYVWLPRDDASPAADNDNEEGAQTPPLPLALVTGVNTATPQLLMVHADHLGRPVRLTDATRATVWSAAYDPFGQPWQVTGTVEQNLRFPGQYFLIESGLSYNWHRFYDPATGRYTQPDPLRFVDGPSVYGYAGASPMMRVDPEGRQALPVPIPLPPPVFPWPGGGSQPWVPGRPFPKSPAGGLPSLPPIGSLPLGPIVPLIPLDMAIPKDWPKTGSCNPAEIQYCEQKCASKCVDGCYVTIGYTVKGVRNGNTIRIQKRTVNCNCGE